MAAFAVTLNDDHKLVALATKLGLTEAAPLGVSGEYAPEPTPFVTSEELWNMATAAQGYFYVVRSSSKSFRILRAHRKMS